MSTANDFARMREALIDFIWGKSGLPTGNSPRLIKGAQSCTLPPCNQYGKYDADERCYFAQSLRNLKRVDTLVVAMEANEHSRVHHFIADKSNHRLAIVHQGHACDFGRTDPASCDWGEINTIDTLLAAGYSVLGMYMPHFEPDFCAQYFYATADPHDEMFHKETVSDGSLVKTFFEPITIALNYIETHADTDEFPRYFPHYGMVGLSGGGWTTSTYPALDARVLVSVAVAGSQPHYMGICSPPDVAKAMGWVDFMGGNPPTPGYGPCPFGYGGPAGDAEQVLPGLYSIAGMLEFYALGAFGSGRYHIQVQNRHDDCCSGENQFAGPGTGPGTWEKDVRDYEARVQAALKSAGPGKFAVVIDEAATKHEISKWAVANVILPAMNEAFAAAEAAADAGADAAAGNARDANAADGVGAAHDALPDAGASERTTASSQPSCACTLGGREARGTPSVGAPLAGLSTTVPTALIIALRRRRKRYL